MTLPEQIKKIREGLELSQRELAKRMEVPQSTVVRIESGEMNVSQKTIDKFCEATNSYIAILPLNKTQEIQRDLMQENLFLKEKLTKILRIITNL